MKKLLLAITLCALWATNANAGYTWKLIGHWYSHGGNRIHCEYVNYYDGSTYVWYHNASYGCARYRNH